MGSLNCVTLIGNLGADPEGRSVGNGGRVVNLRIATSETWKDRDGEKQERVEWHRVTVWNEPLGEVAEKYLRKGSKVYIQGQLETRKWDDNGVDRYSTEVVLRPFNSKLVMLDSAPEGGGDRGRGGGNTGRRGNDRDPGGYTEGRSKYRTGGNERDSGGGGFGGGREDSRGSQRGGGGSKFGGNFDEDLEDDIPF